MGSIHSYQSSKGRRYRVLYRKPDHSQGQKRGFATKKEAELYLSSVEISKSRGDYIDPTAGRVTVAQLGSEWIAAQSHLKPSALKAITSSWRTWVEPYWGRYAIADIRHGDVRTWVASISGSRSATTTTRAYGVLAGMLDVAVLDRRLPSNPARGVKMPRKVRARKIYLSHEQVERLARATGEHGALVYFLSYTGARWGEATGLRVGDIDLLRRRASIVDNAVDVGGRIVVGTPKTHRIRTVPFPKFLSRILEAEMSGKSASDLLFGDGSRHVPLPHSVRGWFAACLRGIQSQDPDFPRLTPHELRHTAASLAISAGANVKAVQRMLGHASAAMTLDIYADLFDDDLSAVADALEEARERAITGVA